MNPQVQLLLVEPDAAVRDRVVEALALDGIQVASVQRASEVLPAMDAAEFDAVLLALRLPDGDGLEVLPRLASAHGTVPVVIITAHSSIPSAVEAMRRGAFDYLPKPFSPEQVRVRVQKALESRDIHREMSRLREEDRHRYGVEAIVGHAPLVRSLREHIRKIAASPATTVLVLGESGVGKDLAARALHCASPRARRPFVAINCPSIPETLMESELFGAEPGAFTDAKRTKRGLLEVAHGGTVFLDEVGDLRLPLQAKLLRFLEDQKFRRLGGTRDIAVDVRVVAATNMELGTAIAAGRFREDLYYRLMVVPLFVLPLRERKEDVPLLATHFLDHFNKRFRKHFESVEPEAMERLAAYGWPGNVRELRNVVERIVLLEEGPVLRASMLPWGTPGTGPGRRRPEAPAPGAGAAEDDLHLGRMELRALVRALERTGGNVSRTARTLGISRDTVRARMRRFGIRVETRLTVSSSPARAVLGTGSGDAAGR